MATATVGLHALLARADLGLECVAGPRADRPVRWVHICELRDPGHYLTGGELLLTAGVDFPPTARDTHRYVRRLVTAGAAALGFGVTPIHDDIPPDLLRACDRHGLPLVRVPGQTSFLEISQVVSLMLAAQERAAQHRISVAQAALTRAAARPDGIAAVTRQLAAALGGWATLVDPNHRLTEAGTPPTRRDDVEDLAARLLTPGGPVSATTHHHEGPQVIAQALARTNRVLITGRPTPFHTADRAILEVAVALLTVLSGHTGPHPRTPPQPRPCSPRPWTAPPPTWNPTWPPPSASPQAVTGRSSTPPAQPHPANWTAPKPPPSCPRPW